MDKEDAETLLYKVDSEGFDYCFTKYSSWKEIKDTKFHELREQYCVAAKKLQNFLDKLAEKHGIEI